jgi:hypothetical protein
MNTTLHQLVQNNTVQKAIKLMIDQQTIINYHVVEIVQAENQLINKFIISLSADSAPAGCSQSHNNSYKQRQLCHSAAKQLKTSGNYY